MIDLVFACERDNRHLFPVLQEPVFFRRVREWILAGKKEREAILQGIQTG